METNKHPFPWLALLDRPAFCVKNGIVIDVNRAAEHRMLQIGMDVRDIVTEHRDVYETFESGNLYLTITVGQLPCSASVTRTNECDIFLIHQSADDDNLQILALAAQQLRIPLSNIMTVTDRYFAGLDALDANTQQQVNQINRGLFQLLRIVSNMSDASGYRKSTHPEKETLDIAMLFNEVIEKVQAIFTSGNIRLVYTKPNISMFGLVNKERLERAIYNLLSNAIKFSPINGTVEAKLIKCGSNAIFTLSNSNSEDLGNRDFWHACRREPALEDSRFGLGLGMSLISSIASEHGGTVLVDHPTPSQTRVTMTIAIVKDDSGTVRSPVFRIGDYAGGRDKGLMELSEILPSEAYQKIN